MLPLPIRDELEAAGWPIRSAELTATQGTRSETFRVELTDGWGILKLYNHNGGSPSEKCAREWLALGSYAGLRCIPQRLAQSSGSWLLMRLLPGQTLRSRWDGLDAPARQRHCRDLGATYAGIAQAPQVAEIHAQVRASRPVPWLDDLQAALGEIERALASQQRLSSPTFARTAERVRILADAADLPQVLFKADCNVSNTLVDAGAVSGIIDWEEACVADRWTILGIVLDHTHFLDWPAVRAGLEAVGGAWSRDEEELVLAAGFLCMWRKLIRMRPGSHWYAQAATQEARLIAMAAAMGRTVPPI